MTLFYRGSSLPTTIFGDFLSIPATFKQLAPVSYLEANQIIGPGAARGFGQLFGASAFKGGDVDQYMNAFRQWNAYSRIMGSTMFATVLAFTPVIDAQILVGRANGGNLMDPPRGNYAAIQVQTQMAPGLLTIPSFVAGARQNLFSS